MIRRRILYELDVNKATKQINVAGCEKRYSIQMEHRKATASRIQSSISSPYKKEGFLQLSQEAAVSVRMYSTDYKRWFAIIGDVCPNTFAAEHTGHYG